MFPERHFETASSECLIYHWHSKLSEIEGVLWFFSCANFQEISKDELQSAMQIQMSEQIWNQKVESGKLLMEKFRSFQWSFTLPETMKSE